MSGQKRHLKGLVLAGSTGNPQLPFGHAAPSGLFPVANRPLLAYAVEDLVRAGIREIGVVSGEGCLQVREVLGDGSRFGAALTFIHQEKPLGPAHALRCAEHFLSGDPFVLYQGDTLLAGGIGTLVAAFLDSEAAALVLLAPVERPEHGTVAITEGDRLVGLVGLVERPDAPPGNLMLVGVCCADQRLLAAARRVVTSAPTLAGALQWLIEHGEPVGQQRQVGGWVAVGSGEDLLTANRLALQAAIPTIEGQVDAESRLVGPVGLAAGVRVVRSVLRGPLLIGAGTLVRESVVGPFTAIGESCMLEDCAIEGSVVMAHSRIGPTGRPIAASIIGRYTRIGREERSPLAYRLALGDHSTLSVP